MRHLSCPVLIRNGLACHRSGTCALAALLRGSRLHISWVGDCRAVLISDEATYTQLTVDQRSTDSEEQKRIKAVGGEVIWSLRLQPLASTTMPLSLPPIHAECPFTNRALIHCQAIACSTLRRGRGGSQSALSSIAMLLLVPRSVGGEGEGSLPKCRRRPPTCRVRRRRVCCAWNCITSLFLCVDPRAPQIIDGRVWGALIPSRTLGDFPWKVIPKAADKARPRD